MVFYLKCPGLPVELFFLKFNLCSPEVPKPMGSRKKYQPIWSRRLASYSEHIKERRGLLYTAIAIAIAQYL